MSKKTLEHNLKQEIKTNFNINENIKNSNILLVTDTEKKVCSLKEALEIAQNANLDLVEFKNTKEQSICKLMNFDDFVYYKLKNTKQKKQNDEHKIIKLRSTIDERDLNRKLKQIDEFLKNKCTVEIKIIQSKRRIINGKKENYISLTDRCVIIYNRFQALGNYNVKLNKDKVSFNIEHIKK